jgi:hypothetical protein
MSRVNIPSTFRQLRSRAGMPKNSKHAKTALPPAYHGDGRDEEEDEVQGLEEATVAAVSVAVPAPALVIATGVLVPKLRVGTLTAPLGLEVMEAVSATLPVKPPAGVILIVEALPVVAPGATETAVPVTAKLGGVVAVSPTVVEMLEP